MKETLVRANVAGKSDVRPTDAKVMRVLVTASSAEKVSDAGENVGTRPDEDAD